MKFLKITLLILFTITIVILVFFLVKSSNNSNNIKSEKLIAEIKYIDNKLTYLLNAVNNITLDNYKVTVTKTKTEQYGLEEDRVLTGNQATDWEKIKNEIEILYSTAPTLTLDLYSMNVNQDEILNFNKELDNLTVSAKEENKEQALIKLANLYRYLPAYASSFSDDIEFVYLLETKSYVFNAYVFSNIDKWQETSNYIKKAIESYSKVLNNLNNTQNSYDTNKIYIILNELQNAANIKDKDIFLIKYKNFLKEAD